MYKNYSYKTIKAKNNGKNNVFSFLSAASRIISLPTTLSPPPPHQLLCKIKICYFNNVFSPSFCKFFIWYLNNVFSPNFCKSISIKAILFLLPYYMRKIPIHCPFSITQLYNQVDRHSAVFLEPLSQIWHLQDHCWNHALFFKKKLHLFGNRGPIEKEYFHINSISDTLWESDITVLCIYYSEKKKDTCEKFSSTY